MREDRLCAAEDDLFRALLRWAIHRAELAPSQQAPGMHVSGGRAGVEPAEGGEATRGGDREVGGLLEELWGREWMDAWLPSTDAHLHHNAIHPGMMMHAADGVAIGYVGGGQEGAGEGEAALTADDSGVSAVESVSSSREEGDSAMDTPAKELKRLQKEVGLGLRVKGLGKELKRLQKEVGACIFICVCKWQGLFAWSACIRACVRTRRRYCACSSSWFTPVLPFVLFVCSFVDFSSNCNLRAVCGRTNACNVAELPRLKRSSKLRVRIPLCPIP